MLVMMLVLCCWVKHPPPRVSTTNDYRSFMGYAMPPISRKKKADALLSIEVLDEHFPVQTYDAAMGSDQQGVSNANDCDRRPARDDEKAVPSVTITNEEGAETTNIHGPTAPLKPERGEADRSFHITNAEGIQAKDVCSVCLEHFSGDATVRVLECDHIFHAACVTSWLCQRSAHCPVCRRDYFELMPKPPGLAEPRSNVQDPRSGGLVIHFFEPTHVQAVGRGGLYSHGYDLRHN